MSPAPGSRLLEQQMQMHCFTVGGDMQELPVSFAYDPSDPYAVWLTFHAEDQDIRWAMCRSLISRGLTDPAGEGDVQVWPNIDDDGRAVVVFEFSSPDGHLVAQAHTHELYRFLTRTLAAVPFGTEAQHFDLDLLITDLLGAQAE